MKKVIIKYFRNLKREKKIGWFILYVIILLILFYRGYAIPFFFEKLENIHEGLSTISIITITVLFLYFKVYKDIKRWDKVSLSQKVNDIGFLILAIICLIGLLL